jgi:hypothetical protein
MLGKVTKDPNQKISPIADVSTRCYLENYSGLFGVSFCEVYEIVMDIRKRVIEGNNVAVKS